MSTGLEGCTNRPDNDNRLMDLAGQGNRGYAMAALLVGMSVMAVLMGALLPVWTHMATREKEAELIFRGNQYARAIGLFQRKFANTPPPTIDVLVEQRFLRKKYKDPITKEDFQPIYANQAMMPGGPPHRSWRLPAVGPASCYACRAGWTSASARLQQHRRHLRRRHHRRDLEEQGRVDQDSQRPPEIQRVGVRSCSDVPASGPAGTRGSDAWFPGGAESAAGPGAAATAEFTVWHAAGRTGRVPGSARAGAESVRPTEPAARSGR